MKAFWRNAALLAVSLLPFSSANALALQAKQYGDFDRYVLALSWQTGFCQSQHDRNRNERDECRLQTETTNKADFLTVQVNGCTNSLALPAHAVKPKRVIHW